MCTIYTYLEAGCPGVVCGVSHIELEHDPPLEFLFILGTLLAPVGAISILHNLLVALSAVYILPTGLVQSLVLAK